MTQEIIELIVKALFGLLALGGLWLVSFIKDELAAKISAQQASELDRLIYDFVAAAEQQLKEEDPDGSKRKAYVVEQLNAVGIAISQEINARIEAAVYEINLNN